MALARIVFLMVSSVLMISSCGTQSEIEQIRITRNVLAAVFNPPEPEQLTATRASLEEAGFTQPLLAVTLREPETLQSALILESENRGIFYWRGADRSTLMMDRGIVRGTVGIGFDLFRAETDRTYQALSGDRSAPYPRAYRHLNALNQVDKTLFFCEMGQPTRETIVVFDRSHQTRRFSERCVADQPNADQQIVEFVNTYWIDQNRVFVWKSDQWISNQVGNILLERVIE